MISRKNNEILVSQIDINPTSLSPLEQGLLYELLYFKFGAVRSFTPGQPYMLEEPPSIVTFTHEILRRDYQGRACFYVISDRNIREERSYLPNISNIRMVLGELQHENNGILTFVPHPDTVMIEDDIDPLTMTFEQTIVFDRYLTDIRTKTGNQIFQSGLQHFKISGDKPSEQVLFYLNFKYPLLCYEKKSGQYAYELMGPEIGRGEYGKVFSGLGTWIPEGGGFSRFKLPRHVVKECFHPAYDPRRPQFGLFREYNMAKKTPHLHTKIPTFMASPNKKFASVSYRRERYQRGIKLTDIILEDQQKKGLFLGTLKRLELSIALLRALKEQVSDCDITNRDIKPDNMIINRERLVVALVIDYGLAKLTLDREEAIVGTPLYRSIESYKGQHTDESTDLYSVGIMIAELSGMKFDGVNSIQDAIQFASAPRFAHLFETGGCYLTGRQKRLFRKALTRITHPDKNKRGTVLEAIDAFDAIRTSYKLQFVLEENKPLWLLAHQEGLSLRKKFYDTAKERGAQMISYADVLRMANEIYISMNKLADVSYIVEEFIYSLGIQEFVGCSSFKQISEKMCNVLLLYKYKQDELSGFLFWIHLSNNENMTDETRILFTRLENKIKHALAKCEKIKFSMDNVVELTEKLERKLRDDIRPLINYIANQSVASEVESLRRPTF